MPTSNPAADSLGKIVQVCLDYAQSLPPASQEALLEYVQKHTRVVNAAIKDEPDVANHDQ